MAFKCNKDCPTCKYSEYVGADTKIQGKTIYCNLKFMCHHLDIKKVKMNIEIHK